jgi:pimeloyl-ACP methyl ester carboxylesterase
VKIDGRELEVVRIDGGEPSLVFLHDGLGSVSTWRDFPETVARTLGARAIVFSRAGYGRSRSIALPRPLTFMHDEARALPALLDACGLARPVLIGHSDGASIALLFAAAHPERVRGLVLEAPHTFVEEVCVEAIAARRKEYARGGELRARVARHHDDPDGAFYGWVDAWLDPEFQSWDLRPQLPSVRAPILAIQGEDDEYGTLRQIAAVEEGAGAPVERLILPACGHAPHRDHAAAVAQAMVRFIRELG